MRKSELIIVNLKIPFYNDFTNFCCTFAIIVYVQNGRNLSILIMNSLDFFSFISLNLNIRLFLGSSWNKSYSSNPLHIFSNVLCLHECQGELNLKFQKFKNKTIKYHQKIFTKVSEN